MEALSHNKRNGVDTVVITDFLIEQTNFDINMDLSSLRTLGVLADSSYVHPNITKKGLEM